MMLLIVVTVATRAGSVPRVPFGRHLREEERETERGKSGVRLFVTCHDR
jgi:hypothetical protein